MNRHGIDPGMALPTQAEHARMRTFLEKRGFVRSELQQVIGPTPGKDTWPELRTKLCDYLRAKGGL